jgi:hypothetical protein
LWRGEERERSWEEEEKRGLSREPVSFGAADMGWRRRSFFSAKEERRREGIPAEILN